jgi:hypothetical protein
MRYFLILSHRNCNALELLGTAHLIDDPLIQIHSSLSLGHLLLVYINTHSRARNSPTKKLVPQEAQVDHCSLSYTVFLFAFSQVRD